MITKYAINTVMIARLGTNRKTIQVHQAAHQSVRAFMKARGSQKCITL